MYPSDWFGTGGVFGISTRLHLCTACMSYFNFKAALVDFCFSFFFMASKLFISHTVDNCINGYSSEENSSGVWPVARTCLSVFIFKEPL